MPPGIESRSPNRWTSPATYRSSECTAAGPPLEQLFWKSTNISSTTYSGAECHFTGTTLGRNIPIIQIFDKKSSTTGKCVKVKDSKEVRKVSEGTINGVIYDRLPRAKDDREKSMMRVKSTKKEVKNVYKNV